MQIERFNRGRHKPESFSCGKRDMDDFLRNYGASEAHGNTYVVVKGDGSREIIAYFTMLNDPVDLEEEFEEGDSITYITPRKACGG